MEGYMSEAWAKIKTNHRILVMNMIICGALTAGYAVDVAKGRKTVAFVAVFVVLLAIQLVVCGLVYRNDKSSDNYKYYSLAGCMATYCFAMFASDSYFTFIYIFPLTVLYILYGDKAFVRSVGVLAAILNIFKIVFQIYHGYDSNADITSYTVQLASVAIYVMGMYFVTDLSKKINEERIEKLLETNRAVSDLARHAEEVRKVEAVLVQDIIQISGSFVSGTKQIAAGAQALAQGSTEQAAAIEELSSAVAEITARTKSSTTKAEKAATLANEVLVNAEKSSGHMDEMIAAVSEINEASNSISQVIKVIDDIAFQTNILALNAAVEAARAGELGKGFAVVAEEVRNLAAKSAEASKDTGSLIENSIEKANLGARIAGETAKSLASIVGGISESSLFIGEIARLSEEQSADIEQLNLGIEQVSTVVQQNSATAEESAASAQEMSSQASLLDELIMAFKDRTDEK